MFTQVVQSAEQLSNSHVGKLCAMEWWSWKLVNFGKDRNAPI